MTVDETDILIRIDPLVPCLDHIQTIPGARKTRGIELELALLDHLRAVLLHEIPDYAAGLVQPLLHVVCLVPPPRPDGSLGARLEQVGLIAQLPICKFLAVSAWGRQCFADQRHGADEGIVPNRPVLAQIEPVDVADVRPCRIAIEVRRPDRDRRRIVPRPVEVECPQELFALCSIEGRVVSMA